MYNRLPQARDFANSTAKLSIILRGKNGPRCLEVSPALAGSLTALAALVAVVYMAATTYLIFKDDVLRMVLSGQARMQYAYEDRISQLRAHIDRVAAHQLLDQDTVESRLHELISRQVQLESRQVLVARLSDDASKAGVKLPEAALPPDALTTGSVRPLAAPSAPAPLFRPAARPKPAPEGMTVRQAPQPLDELRTDKVTLRGMPAGPKALPAMLDHVQTASRQLATRQIATLRALEQSAQGAAHAFRTALDKTGLDQQRFAKLIPRSAPAPAVGGPLVPITNAEAAAFEKSYVAAQNYLQETEKLSKIIRTLPLRRPLGREYDTSSTFGPRLDPFTRGVAMHTGLDFRATTGTPVKATGDGKVVEAGWVGGYGRMVEIDHGFGITTRYGHMSAIEVAVGDTIRKGTVVGLVGSTGRSTGPHLHYEVRIDDEATDPFHFVRAGERAAIN